MIEQMSIIESSISHISGRRSFDIKSWFESEGIDSHGDAEITGTNQNVQVSRLRRRLPLQGSGRCDPFAGNDVPP